MITNNGITLLGKYLTGQMSAFASHIAIGCGPDVLASDENFGDYSAKQSLDFEVDRFPIISRTTNVIDGEQQIIFTAEVPSDVRYGITEIGVFPAESNNIVGSIPSQRIFSFTTNEGWQKSLSGVISDLEIESDIIDETTQDINTTAKAFFLASDNAIFRSEDRLKRKEQPRFLNSSVVVAGNLTSLSAGELNTAGSHIFISQPNLPELDNANVYSDSIKFAFSVIGTQLESAPQPSSIKIKIIFYTDAGATATYSYSSTIANNNSRYVTDSKLLKDLESTSGFVWKDVTSVKIFANVDSAADNYIALDGLRFENLSSLDDKYAMVGYSKIKSSDETILDLPKPIEKPEGSATYVEFRFALDVL